MKKIEIILKNIRNKYARIRQMTETLDIDSKPETCSEIIKLRAGLLSEIEEEQNLLDQICSQWRKQCDIDPGLATLKSEIQLLIAAAVALDSAIHDKFTQKVEEIKAEICNLNQSSKAALSYAQHRA